jgi:hypothetical protein
MPLINQVPLRVLKLRWEEGGGLQGQERMRVRGKQVKWHCRQAI